MQLATIGGTMAIHYSDDLPHFAERDPPRRGEKVAERKLLQEQIEAFLAAGGTITEHGTQGQHFPLRRTRKAQVNFIKNYHYKRRKKDRQDE